MSRYKSNFAKLALVMGVFVLGYGLAEIPNHLNNREAKVDTESLCLLSTSECQFGEVSATLSQDVVKAMQPTQMNVLWPNSESNTLLISLKGVEMEMGEPRFELTRGEGDHFTGELLLPVCTSDAMTWVGTINDGHSAHAFSLNMER